MPYLDKYFSNFSSDQRHTSVIAYLASLDYLTETAPHVAHSIVQELHDQRTHLKLIASENYSSLAVQLAMGNLLTDKYAEGYPFHRFYAGCENIDTIEAATIDEVKNLFGCDHAYVQPHSGADANMVAFWAVLVQRIQTAEVERLGKKSIDELTPEEYERVRQLMCNQKILGMSLNSGGHLTHGYRHNVSSKMMQASTYEVDQESGLLDYQAIAEQAQKVQPTILMAGYSAYPRKVNFAKMREIADSVGAVLIVDMAHFSGLVAGKVWSGDYSPVPHAHLVTSTTHKTLRGPRGGMVLCTEEFKEVVDKGCPLILGGPLPHVMAAKAVAFKEANSQEFQTYSQAVVDNAAALAGRLVERGVRLLTGGTDNHLMILDVSSFGITGRQAELALREAHLTVNRNAIPYDANGPWYTSGVRIGTPALTSLGMGTDQMLEVADILVDTLQATKPNIVKKTGKPSKAKSTTEPEVLKRNQEKVEVLLARYRLYPEIPDLSI